MHNLVECLNAQWQFTEVTKGRHGRLDPTTADSLHKKFKSGRYRSETIEIAKNLVIKFKENYTTIERN